MVELIQQSAGGQAEPEIDTVARKVERPKLALRASEIKRHLGVEVPVEKVQRILSRLGFAVETKTASEWLVQVPTWRLDVEREIDLIEEIARIFGLMNIPSTLPSFGGAVVEQPEAAKSALLRERLLALGYSESISTTFIPQEEARVFGGGEPVRLANPLSEEAAYLRTSLLPGLVAQVAYNLNRGNTEVRLFETGDVFELQGDRVEERRRTAFVATGAAGDAGVFSKAEPYGFFEMKGEVESLLAAFDLKSVYFDRLVPEYFHSGRSARVVAAGQTVARFGQLSAEVAAGHKLKQEVFVAELMLERLFAYPLRQPDYKPVPRFPAVGRDFSFVFGREVEFERMEKAVAELNLAELQSFRAVEVFLPKAGSPAAKNLGEGRYSILLRARFQSPERTLRDEEVAAWSQQIISRLEKLGGTLRA